MRKVGIITHPDCRLHNQPGHPENAGRTDAIEQYLRKSDLVDKLVWLTARAAELEQVELNHDRAYIEWVVSRIESGFKTLDPDTYITAGSLRAALLSYGGGLMAAEKVCNDELDRAFCCLRPPGHHAEADRAMGFCIFNNIAGAARYAQKHYQCKRIAIIDFDVHHGNGTQWSFYNDDKVHYTSLHQYPFYPGTGSDRETGEGKGKGFTLNLPLPAGTNGKEALTMLKEKWLPAINSFHPDLVLISAGFDAHISDPLAGLCSQEEDYYTITKMISDVADEHCGGKIVSVLEGGYYPGPITQSAYQHLRGLLSD